MSILAFLTFIYFLDAFGWNIQGNRDYRHVIDI